MCAGSLSTFSGFMLLVNLKQEALFNTSRWQEQNGCFKVDRRRTQLAVGFKKTSFYMFNLCVSDPRLVEYTDVEPTDVEGRL